MSKKSSVVSLAILPCLLAVFASGPAFAASSSRAVRPLATPQAQKVATATTITTNGTTRFVRPAVSVVTRVAGRR